MSCTMSLRRRPRSLRSESRTNSVPSPGPWTERNPPRSRGGKNGGRTTRKVRCRPCHNGGPAMILPEEFHADYSFYEKFNSPDGEKATSLKLLLKDLKFSSEIQYG